MKNENPKSKLFIRYGIFAVIFVLVVFIILNFSKKETEGYTSPPPAVEIIKPENKDINQSISISGYVEALDMIPVVPFVSGTIMEYPIKSGMQINKGELIAKIDDEPY
jgi:multidrug efflux pump subunit AcrA (membrane-fusion protein)